MEAVLRLAATIALSAPILCAAWSIWLAFSDPIKLLQMQRIVAREHERVAQTHATDVIFLILSLIGYGQFIFGGMRIALHLLSGYGDVEDGEWVSYAYSIGMVIAIWGAAAFLGAINDYARLKFFRLNRNDMPLPR